MRVLLCCDTGTYNTLPLVNTLLLAGTRQWGSTASCTAPWPLSAKGLYALGLSFSHRWLLTRPRFLPASACSSFCWLYTPESILLEGLFWLLLSALTFRHLLIRFARDLLCPYIQSNTWFLCVLSESLFCISELLPLSRMSGKQIPGSAALCTFCWYTVPSFFLCNKPSSFQNYENIS